MSSTLPVFTPIEDGLYLTLCGRALDNHIGADLTDLGWLDAVPANGQR